MNKFLRKFIWNISSGIPGAIPIAILGEIPEKKNPPKIPNGNPREIPTAFTEEMSREVSGGILEWILGKISDILPVEFPGTFSKINAGEICEGSLDVLVGIFGDLPLLYP